MMLKRIHNNPTLFSLFKNNRQWDAMALSVSTSDFQKVFPLDISAIHKISKHESISSSSFDVETYS